VSSHPCAVSERRGAPEVDFINILRAAFAPIFFCQKITKPDCNYREKMPKALLYKKAGLKC